jgi:hypothetical protein
VRGPPAHPCAPRFSGQFLPIREKARPTISAPRVGQRVTQSPEKRHPFVVECGRATVVTWKEIGHILPAEAAVLGVYYI